MSKNRAGLVDKIEKNIHLISNNKNATDEIKQELSKYRIHEGRIEEYLSNPAEVLEDADARELALLTEQIYVKTGDQEFNPENWFTTSELKEARQFDYVLTFGDEEIQFPLEFENVIHIGNDLYAVPVDVKIIAQLLRSNKLNYNYEIQRQASFTKRKEFIITKPTVYKQNVKEIKNLLLKGELVHTTLAFNAAVNTSDTGEELQYNSKKNILTINDGTRLDILDGYHRCLASEQAYSENPELNFKFLVLISNYTTREAQQYQAQLAKATPIPVSRVQELEVNRPSDTVVQVLKSGSELKGRISLSNTKMNQAVGELVSYRVLTDAIEREFTIKTKLEAREIGEYLSEFFDYLIGSYPEEFIEFENYDTSIMAYNRMFAGYVALAAEMRNKGIKLNKLKEIVDGIDFNKNNPKWEELNVVREDGKLNHRMKESDISKYFKTLI